MIIFDCDGTLVDSEPISNQVVADMMTDAGLPMTKDQSIALFAGKKFADIEAYLEKHLNNPLSFDFEKEFRIQSKIAFEKELKPMPGVISFIESLEIPFCVASNGPRTKMDTTLSVSGLSYYFNEVNTFSAYDIKRWKPQPDLFIHVCAKMNTSLEQCLVIEDTISGVQAALNAKIDCIAYNPKDESNLLEAGVPNFKYFDKLDIRNIDFK